MGEEKNDLKTIIEKVEPIVLSVPQQTCFDMERSSSDRKTFKDGKDMETFEENKELKMNKKSSSVPSIKELINKVKKGSQDSLLESEVNGEPEEGTSGSFPSGKSIEMKPMPRKGGVPKESTEPHSSHQLRPLLASEEKTDLVKVIVEGKEKAVKAAQVSIDQDFERDEGIFSAKAAMFFAIFNLGYSTTLAYWHHVDEMHTETTLTAALVIVSGIFVTCSFLFTKNPRNAVWKRSKALFLLATIPCLSTLVLSFVNLVFSVKERSSRAYKRPWSQTHGFFLLESLALCFPQTILQGIIVFDDPRGFPTIKGCLTVAGIMVLFISMAFSRIRYDSYVKPFSFGVGVEKLIIYALILSSKVLWFVCYVITILSIRKTFPEDLEIATIAAFAAITAVFEIPMFIASLPKLYRFYLKLEGVLFVLPQFVALAAAIYWVNVDPGLYDTNAGCLILGTYFYAEVAIVCVWLMQRCVGKDIELSGTYPYFLGDITTSCCKTNCKSC